MPPAASGAFPHVMSREMPRHNAVMYRMAPVETEPFSPHYRGSVHTYSTFRGQSPALPCSLDQAVSRVAMTSPHHVDFNSSTVHSGAAAQKQLPDEVASVAQALACQTSHEAVVSTRHYSTDTVMSVSIANTFTALTEQPNTVLSIPDTFTAVTEQPDTVLSASIADTFTPVTEQPAQTVSVTCAEPVSSSPVQYATETADEKLSPCSEVKSGSGHSSSIDDGTVFNDESARLDETLDHQTAMIDGTLDHQTARLDERLDHQTTRLDERLDHQEARLDETDHQATRLDETLDHQEARLDGTLEHQSPRLDESLDHQEARLDQTLDHQTARLDGTLAAGDVKVEPKIEMETGSDDVSQQPPVTDIKVEVKTEQLKVEIKSEVASEECVDGKDEQLQLENDAVRDSAAVGKLACDADVKKAPSRKGIC